MECTFLGQTKEMKIECGYSNPQSKTPTMNIMSILFVAECDLGGWGYQNSSYYPSTKSQTRGTGFQRLGRGELRLFFVQEREGGAGG